jgi:hypothetical protein
LSSPNSSFPSSATVTFSDGQSTAPFSVTINTVTQCP